MRKRKTQEVISKALYADDPHLYTVLYRDYDQLVEESLLTFLEKEIPAHRIVAIYRDGVIVYRKGERL
ncbi:MAG TPA: DUF504 domain-containing protein [Candidatus Bathyarchaeota archaeon]|nr:DUF504 domain-containing protein [Candidatus Bathyarchaeota archaeon]